MITIRSAVSILCLLGAVLVAGCGKKGPLYLPDGARERASPPAVSAPQSSTAEQVSR